MFRRKDVPGFTVLFTVISDVLAVLTAFLLAWFIRFQSGIISTVDTPLLKNYLLMAVLWALIQTVVFHFLRLYHIRTPLPFMTETARVTQGMMITIALLFAAGFFMRAQLLFSRLTVLLTGVFALLLLLLFREVLRAGWGRFLRKNGFLQRVVLLGWSEKTTQLIEAIRSDINSGRQVIGVLHDTKPMDLHPQIPWLGTPDELPRILEDHDVDEVILGTLQIAHTRISGWILACERKLVSFQLIPDLFEILASRVQLDFVSGVPLLGIGDFPLDRPVNRALKRIVDLVGAIMGLILSIPFLILGAVLIQWESRGPVFYPQERCGRDGKPFRMFKLRTMKVNAEQQTGPVWTSENDPRRTRAGVWLRKFNIDETPQYWNVLLGQMSLVGPRPERPFFVEQFKDEIRHYMPRHIAKPGMTGWAQVNGLRGNTPLEERIRYDLYYYENWSIWFDIRIMIATFLSFKNAY